MPEAQEKPKSERVKGRIVPLLLSKELRWIYFLALGFLLLVTAVFLFAGAYSAWVWWNRNNYIPEDRVSLTSVIVYLCVGLFALILAIGIRQVRSYFHRLEEVTIAEIKSVELSNIKEADFEKIDRIQQLREEKAQADFQRNLNDAFLLKSFELSGVDFFGHCSWMLQPGINILLGRNGYGKSLILRSLVAVLQRDEENSRELFTSAAATAFIQLKIERNGSEETIRRERARFTEAVGKIPALAIPDSRFVNRAETLIEPPREKPLDLRSDGTLHFLDNRPYGEMMTVLFNELCFDYLEERSFGQPIFTLLQKAVETLTGDRFSFHAVERIGRNAFRLMVLTEGNDRPLPIQYASQGTLSVIGVVGIIRSYLKALFPDAADEELLTKPAIVLIDELDAHLHPLWQQKLTTILRDSFPNVQFVLSAHSPLVVAGCWNNEVTVLRKRKDGFEFEQIPHDFIGTSAEDIYKDIFDVEEADPSFLRFAGRATYGFSNQERISELEKKERPTELERREFLRLIREEGMIRRAAEVSADRSDDDDRIMELEAQVDELKVKLQANRLP